MDYGAIIKRSWQITWRYKALWVLGIFAGVSGCAGGSGGGSGGGGSNWSEPSGGSTPFDGLPGSMPDFSRFIPLAIAAGVLLVVIGIVLWVLAIAARGGLVTGVNEIEEGRPRRARELWSAGFSRFWSLLGLDLLLGLPLMVVGLGMAGIILFSVAAPLVRGGEPGPEAFVPICGSLAIGVPLLIVGSFVLGIMHLIALRYVMLGGHGAIAAAGDSWRFLRARMKDSLLMYLLNFALNLAASFALGIPAIIIGVALAVPLVAVVASEEWGALWGIIPAFVLLVTVLSVAYNAIWGTYTSALWTLFFRRAAGMHVDAAPVPAAMQPAAAPVSEHSAPPAPPAPFEPPIAPIPAQPAPPEPDAEPRPTDV